MRRGVALLRRDMSFSEFGGRTCIIDGDRWLRLMASVFLMK